jgi:hypothetical protein
VIGGSLLLGGIAPAGTPEPIAKKLEAELITAVSALGGCG